MVKKANRGVGLGLTDRASCRAAALATAIAAAASSALAGVAASGDVTPGGTWTYSTGAYIGNTSIGQLTVDSGSTLASGTTYLGYNSGSSGTATVSGAGSRWNTSGLYLGRSGSGSLAINAGGQVSAYDLSLGLWNGSTGTATISGSGSKLTVTRDVRVGSYGSANMSITTGAQVTSATGYIRDSGVVSVSGAGSAWTNSAELYVGKSAGAGTLTVSDGGQVTTKTLFGALSDLRGNGTISAKGAVLDTNFYLDATHPLQQNLAFGTGGVLSLNLDGTSTLGAGYKGTGKLTIAQGAVVSSDRGMVGSDMGSDGTVVVTGSGTRWNSGSLTMGQFGIGAMQIGSGARVVGTDTYMGTNGGGNAIASVDGDLARWDQNNLYLGIEGSGKLTIDHGGQVTTKTAYIGQNWSGWGSATLKGNGAGWSNSGSLFVGAQGGGTLSVASGSYVSTGTLLASMSDLSGDGQIYARGAVLDADLRFDASHGTYQTLAFGTGGSLSISIDGSGDLGVGHRGTGTMSIAEGAQVISSSGYLGYQHGANGTARVTGPGSQWRNTWGLFIGHTGTGMLEISNGGKVSNYTTEIGYWYDGTGSAKVSGPGSELDTQMLELGYNGTGAVRVEAGGRVTSSSASVAGNSAGSSKITVTGAGSEWVNQNDIRLGNGYSGGSGSLAILNGGKVTASQVQIAASSSLRLGVSGNGMLVLGNETSVGSLANDGTVTFAANAYLPAGSYRPITDYSGRELTWTGTGGCKTIGGSWDQATKTFSVSEPTIMLAGGSATASEGARFIVIDPLTYTSVGASIGTSLYYGEFSAMPVYPYQLDSLRTEGTVLSAWTFNMNGIGQDTILSFNLGAGLDEQHLQVWGYDGYTGWSQVLADDLTYSPEGILSFGSQDRNSYAIVAVPEPGIVAALGATTVALGLRKRRK